MRAAQLLETLSALDVRVEVQTGKLQVDAPKGIITEVLRNEIITNKSDLISLLVPIAPQSQEAISSCPQCGGELESREQPNFWFYTCKQKRYNCYEEIRRKAEANRLWDDVPTPEEWNEQRATHAALEGLPVLGVSKTGTCEVGCGSLITFYLLDGVGYGRCTKCKVDQTLYESRLM